ncbi:MAG: hypothetical protein FRX49_11778 [Trebouxia sp. A1-2]|nr:MAG: hypothetical protein FRX49_11778 [Trebouxia sp. A1-2]
MQQRYPTTQQETSGNTRHWTRTTARQVYLFKIDQVLHCNEWMIDRGGVNDHPTLTIMPGGACIGASPIIHDCHIRGPAPADGSATPAPPGAPSPSRVPAPTSQQPRAKPEAKPDGMGWPLLLHLCEDDMRRMRCSKRWRVYMPQHTPALTRPALPLRCRAEALLTQSSTSRLMPRLGSCRRSYTHMLHEYLEFATVHHIYHVLNGQTSLSNVGGNHNLAHSLRGALEGLALVTRGHRGMKRDDPVEDKDGSITVLLVNVGHQLLQQIKVNAVLIKACYVALSAAAVLPQGLLAEVGIQGGFQGVPGVVTPPSLQPHQRTFVESQRAEWKCAYPKQTLPIPATSSSLKLPPGLCISVGPHGYIGFHIEMVPNQTDAKRGNRTFSGCPAVRREMSRSLNRAIRKSPPSRLNKIPVVQNSSLVERVIAASRRTWYPTLEPALQARPCKHGCCKARDCLSGFAAASITTDHHDIMLSELRQQVLSDGEHRQASPAPESRSSAGRQWVGGPHPRGACQSAGGFLYVLPPKAFS